MARFWMARWRRMKTVTMSDVTVTSSSNKLIWGSKPMDLVNESIIVILHRCYIAKKNEGKGLSQDSLSGKDKDYDVVCPMSVSSEFLCM